MCMTEKYKLNYYQFQNDKLESVSHKNCYSPKNNSGQSVAM